MTGLKRMASHNQRTIDHGGCLSNPDTGLSHRENRLGHILSASIQIARLVRVIDSDAKLDLKHKG